MKIKDNIKTGTTRIKKRGALAIVMTAMVVLAASCFLTSCHDYDKWDNDYEGNLDALWTIIDEHYCFFNEKDVDWDAVRVEYRQKLHEKDKMSRMDFFQLASEMLDELRDGHINLTSPFATSYYRKWWSDYPQNFNLRTLQQYYLNFDWLTLSGLYYKILDDNIAYLRYPSFSYLPGEGNLDYIFHYFKDCKGLIIDIRDNGGGELTNVHSLVGRFITNKTTGGYLIHKTGKGHNDFSSPYPIEYEPAKDNHISWDSSKPVVVLINRSCFSAANDFACVMKELPNVRLAGASTGGGGGLPFTYDIPIGWTVRLSASPSLDRNRRSIENGIEPSEGCAVDAPDIELAQGKDAILDKAISLLKE